MRYPDMIFNFITTDRDFSQKATDIANDIKAGKADNNIKSWFNLIYDACGLHHRGLYVGERNILAQRLMNHYIG